MNISIDLETYSSVPIKDAGAFAYVRSPDFQILLNGFQIWETMTEPRVLDFSFENVLPDWFVSILRDPNYIKHAYNATFEWLCFSRALGEELPKDQWRDTMLQASYHGYPLSLADAGKAIGLPEDKQKMAVIDVIATALGAVTRVPEKVYEATIILIWAAAESTYDVEDLLNGKKIALIKDGKDFHTSLKGSVSSLTDNACDYSNLLSDSQRKQLPAQTDIGTGNGAASVGSKIKLSYEDYLRLLLMSVPGPVKTLRMMAAEDAPVLLPL